MPYSGSAYFSIGRQKAIVVYPGDAKLLVDALIVEYYHNLKNRSFITTVVSILPVIRGDD